MQAFLEITTSDDPNELATRLADLNVYMARSGKLLADVKYMQDKAISNVYAENVETILKMAATVATKFTASQCAQENKLVNQLDRINRACVHQSDNIRTVISFAKEQMSLTRKGY